MAPLANEINAAGLDSRGNDGIALTDVDVKRNNPTHIKYKWSHHKRSPEKFTVWFRNVETQEHYKARETVWTSAGQGQVGLGSLNHKTGYVRMRAVIIHDYAHTPSFLHKYILVLTKHNHYHKIRNSDFT